MIDEIKRMEELAGVEQLTQRENIAKEEIPGERNFDKNFSEQVINKISEHNFKKQEPHKITYLKPTKAALYGLHLRFQDMDRQAREDRKARKVGGRKKEQDSVYLINSQLMANAKTTEKQSSQSMMLYSNKRTVSNTLKGARGRDTLPNRHAVPVNIDQLLKD